MSATRAASRPRSSSNKDALELIVAAIDAAGYKPGTDICLGLDPAATELYQNGQVCAGARGPHGLTAGELIDLYEQWVGDYPIVSHGGWAGRGRLVRAGSS